MDAFITPRPISQPKKWRSRAIHTFGALPIKGSEAPESPTALWHHPDSRPPFHSPNASPNSHTNENPSQSKCTSHPASLLHHPENSATHSSTQQTKNCTEPGSRPINAQPSFKTTSCTHRKSSMGSYTECEGTPPRGMHRGGKHWTQRFKLCPSYREPWIYAVQRGAQ